MFHQWTHNGERIAFDFQVPDDGVCSVCKQTYLAARTTKHGMSCPGEKTAPPRAAQEAVETGDIENAMSHAAKLTASRKAINPTAKPYVVEILAQALTAAREKVKALEAERDYLIRRGEKRERAEKERADSNFDQAQKEMARADAAEARVKAMREALEAMEVALTDHNEILRGAATAAQRDAVHEIEGTTNYRILADRSHTVLTQHHAITNAAREAVQARALAALASAQEAG